MDPTPSGPARLQGWALPDKNKDSRASRTKTRGGRGSRRQVPQEARQERWGPMGGLKWSEGGGDKASRGLGTNGKPPAKASLAELSSFTDGREKAYSPLRRQLSRSQTHPLPTVFSPRSNGDATRPLPSQEKSARSPETRRRSSAPPQGYKVVFSIGYLTC